MVRENKRAELVLPVLVLLLMGYGILAISSAVIGDTSKEGYPLRQILWDALAILLMYATVKMKKNFLRDLAWALYSLSILLLVLVLVLGEEIDEGRERYGLTWAGKADTLRARQ